MASDDRRWPPREARDDRLAAAFAAGLTVADAAHRAGVGERTARRRMADPQFAARVDDLRADAARRINAGLDELADQALAALRDLLAPDVEDRTRLAAARTVLEAGARHREQADLAERIAALERPRPTLPVSNGNGAVAT